MTENGSPSEETMEDSAKQNSSAPPEAAVKKVTADGAYATQSAFTIRT